MRTRVHQPVPVRRAPAEEPALPDRLCRHRHRRPMTRPHHLRSRTAHPSHPPNPPVRAEEGAARTLRHAKAALPVRRPARAADNSRVRRRRCRRPCRTDRLRVMPRGSRTRRYRRRTRWARTAPCPTRTTTRSPDRGGPEETGAPITGQRAQAARRAAPGRLARPLRRPPGPLRGPRWSGRRRPRQSGGAERLLQQRRDLVVGGRAEAATGARSAGARLRLRGGRHRLEADQVHLGRGRPRRRAVQGVRLAARGVTGYADLRELIDRSDGG